MPGTFRLPLQNGRKAPAFESPLCFVCLCIAVATFIERNENAVGMAACMNRYKAFAVMAFWKINSDNAWASPCRDFAKTVVRLMSQSGGVSAIESGHSKRPPRIKIKFAIPVSAC